MNKAILTGRISTDIKLNKTQSGLSAMQFQIACDEGKDKQGKKMTSFITCKAWRNQADFISTWFAKGDGIVIIGKNQSGKYTNRDEVEVKEQYVLVENVEFPVPMKKRDSSGIQVSEDFGVDDYETNTAVEVNEDDLPF